MKKVTEEPLCDDFVSALDEKKQECISLLQITKLHTPKQVVNEIMEYANKLLSQNIDDKELKERALQLGALWGSMVVKEYGWRWQYLDFGNDVDGIYVVSPNSLYCCPPLNFVNKILKGNNTGLDGKNDNTVLLLFNMLNNIEADVPSENYQVLS